MSDATWERVPAACGLGFAGAGVAAMMLDADAQAFALGLASALFAAFLGGLRAHLRREEGETSPFSAVAVVAGSVAAGVYTLAAIFAVESGTELEPFVFGACFSQAVMIVAASRVLRRVDGRSRHLGKAGAPIAAVQVVGAFYLLRDGLETLGMGLSFGSLLLWVTATSLVLLSHGAGGPDRKR